MKHALRIILTAMVAMTAVFAAAGTASASVVVPPGGSGSTCSGYDHVTNHPELYWQTCAWADNNEVYFTVNLGNSGNIDWRVDLISVDSIRSGNFVVCPNALWPGPRTSNIVVRAHSVQSTPTAACAYQRRPGAYASVGLSGKDPTSARCTAQRCRSSSRTRRGAVAVRDVLAGRGHGMYNKASSYKISWLNPGHWSLVRPPEKIGPQRSVNPNFCSFYWRKRA